VNKELSDRYDVEGFREYAGYTIIAMVFLFSVICFNTCFMRLICGKNY